jgi:sugar O-acyltransferase (sialic acid O-acetyltransferase NeuD family)
MRVLLIGAGGHAQVVADALRSRAGSPDAAEIVGYLDDDVSLQGRQLIGGVVLGTLRQRHQIDHDAVIVAIGDNGTRQRIFEALTADTETFAVALHQSAIVAPGVVIAPGAMLSAGAILNPHVQVGPNVIVNTGAIIDHHCEIGAHSHIATGVRLGGSVSVGESTLVGIGAVVLPGRKIGRNAIVGGGATVIDDIPDGVTVVGTPARSRAR